MTHSLMMIAVTSTRSVAKRISVFIHSSLNAVMEQILAIILILACCLQGGKLQSQPVCRPACTGPDSQCAYVRIGNSNRLHAACTTPAETAMLREAMQQLQSRSGSSAPPAVDPPRRPTTSESSPQLNPNALSDILPGHFMDHIRGIPHAHAAETRNDPFADQARRMAHFHDPIPDTHRPDSSVNEPARNPFVGSRERTSFARDVSGGTDLPFHQPSVGTDPFRDRSRDHSRAGVGGRDTQFIDPMFGRTDRVRQSFGSDPMRPFTGEMSRGQTGGFLTGSFHRRPGAGMLERHPIFSDRVPGVPNTGLATGAQPNFNNTCTSMADCTNINEFCYYNAECDCDLCQTV